MIAEVMPLAKLVHERYRAARGDADFASLVDLMDRNDPEGLADLIETDGRIRIALGRPVDLWRYISAVANLPKDSVALDAAIDMTLRSMASQGMTVARARDVLAANYPALSGAIWDAACLAEAVVSTDGLLAGHDEQAPPSTEDVGPLLPGGVTRYRLLDPIGRGSEGSVFRAVDRLLSDEGHEALVAVKLLRAADSDPLMRQRRLDEATKARRVTHQNVVRVLDRGVTPDGREFIVNELMEGGDLDTLLAASGGKLPALRAAGLFARIARGLSAVHGAGLVHCDLKPANIMVTRDGEPKVADFGVAARIGPGSPAASAARGERVGNIAFISPEQFRGEEGCLSVASDIYALGGLLWYALTGTLPNGDNTRDIADAHLPGRGRPRRILRGKATGADSDLELIVTRALAPDAAERYQSASELSTDLEAWLAHEPIRWSEPSLTRRLTLRARRRPLLMATAVGTILLALAGPIAAVYYATSLRALEVRMREDRAQREERDAIMRDSLANMYRLMAATTDQLPTNLLLDNSILLEWAARSAGMADVRTLGIVWDDRVRLARGVVDRGRTEQPIPTLNTLIWESAMAFWLVSAERGTEAIPLMERNIKDWSAKLTPDDPWLRLMAGLRACAIIDARLTPHNPASITDEQVRAAEKMLLAEKDLFVGVSRGTPLHGLALGTLARLYESPDYRDRAALENVRARQRELRMPAPVP